MKEEVVKEKECTRGNTPSFEWPDQTNPQFGGTNDLPKNSWGVSTEIKRFWFRELHIFVRTITSQNKGYFKTSAEGLIKHKPCLEGRNKREPWQKGNRNENEHTHTCVIYTGNLAHRFPYYCFLQPGSECYCNLQQTHCRFKSLHNQSGTQAKLKSLTQQPFCKIRNRQEFLSLQKSWGSTIRRGPSLREAYIEKAPTCGDECQCHREHIPNCKWCFLNRDNKASNYSCEQQCLKRPYSELKVGWYTLAEWENLMFIRNRQHNSEDKTKSLLFDQLRFFFF